MDIRTALLFLVILAALLVAGILFFLFRALRVLDRHEKLAMEIETTTVPLIASLRRMAEEIEPVVKRTTDRYQSIEQGLDSLSRSPILSFLVSFMKSGGRSIHTATYLLRVGRGLAAGFARAREVLKRSDHPESGEPSSTTKEESHGR